jgi:NodT family efflux transporter outer membrane factor (OMF) lipoprotein
MTEPKQAQTLAQSWPAQSKLARGVALGAMSAALSACGHLPIAGPAFEAMETQRAGMPADWIVAPMTGDASAVIADYSVFGDAQLSALIQEALENNRTLRATLENVRQSEALLRQTRSGLFPRVTTSVGVSSTSRGDDEDTPLVDEGRSFEDETYSFGVNGSYSADIMGDVSASIRASQAGLRSTEATYELARRQLAAQVARAYFQVIEQRLQLELARRSLERAQATFRITEIRFEAGSVARDELVLGQSTLATQQADIIASEVQLRTAVRALEAALGRFPQNRLEVTGAMPAAPPTPPLGLPELTIRSRPDVVAAEFNVIQAFGNNRVVRLSRWPQLDATLGVALSNVTAGGTSGLFDLDNVAYSIGATLAQTIFDGGAISGRIAQSDAARRQALERYGQTVIDAYGDVVDSLDNFNASQARLESLRVASDAARETLRLGELRYNEGSESLLNVLNVRDRADLAESTFIANQRAVLEQWILLHLALGGDPTAPTRLATEATTAEGRS